MHTPLTDAPNLIHTGRHTFHPHPQAIPVPHQQLRHLLKATDTGFTYYASRNEVYALKASKRKLIARVDFPIQCLSAGFGWLCMGGPQRGQCAFVRIQLPEDPDAVSQTSAEVDASLPLNLRTPDRSASPESRRSLRRNSSSSFPERAKTIHYKNIGEEIVNAITLQNIPSANLTTPKETVAVVATNDTTVTIFSLDRMEPLCILYYRYQMNHASLSSNGELLLACGDINKAFFHSRKKDRGLWTNDWNKLAEPRVTTFHKNDHCFTTGFSPDQRFCTIASQSGKMVKYEVKRLRRDMKDDAAVVDLLRSSRPSPIEVRDTGTWPGAIRSTAYSPLVWDLVAWAEGKGRICVSDLRNPVRPPQLVQLNEKDPRNIVVELSDVALEDDLDDDESFNQTLRRFGLQRPISNSSSIRDQLNEVGSAVDYLEDAAHLRRLQQVLRSLDRENQDMAHDEPRLQDLMNEIQEMGEELSNYSGSGSRTLRGPPRRRPSVVLNHVEPGASSSEDQTLAPMITSHSTAISASPSQLAQQRIAASLTPPPPLDNSVTQTDVADPWQTISAAMNAETQSRQVSLQANLRNLRETRDSLERAQRASRLRIENSRNTDVYERRPVGARSGLGTESAQRRMEFMQRQHAARLHANLSSSVRARRDTPHTPDPDNSLHLEMEDSLEDSSNRLTQLERELERLESRRATLYRHTVHQTPPPEETATGGGARPYTSAHQSMSMRDQTARYHRLLQNERGGDLSPAYSALLLGRREPSNSSSLPETDIMGLDWSSDGRILFVATTHGIFELRVNLHGRLTLLPPSKPI